MLAYAPTVWIKVRGDNTALSLFLCVKNTPVASSRRFKKSHKGRMCLVQYPRQIKTGNCYSPPSSSWLPLCERAGAVSQSAPVLPASGAPVLFTETVRVRSWGRGLLGLHVAVDEVGERTPHNMAAAGVKIKPTSRYRIMPWYFLQTVASVTFANPFMYSLSDL